MGLRYAAAFALISLTAGGFPAAQAPDPLEAVELAREYVESWHDTLTYLVVDEDYVQEVRAYRMTSSGRAQPMTPTRRRLQSEVLLVRAPADNLWLSFRDVVAVDGTTVSDRKQRFETLFSGPTAAVLSTARRISEESARFNLGRLPRTVNIPTATLAYLHTRYEANTTWTLDPYARLDDRLAWILSFDQRKPPFAVTIQGGVPYPSAGRFWLQPETGRILQTELVVRGGSAVHRVTTTFGGAATIDALVPLRMRDEYEARRVESMNGVATYTNHRLFRTSGRVVGPSSD